MTARPAAAAPAHQRSALVPGVLAAIILFTAPALITGPWFLFVQYAVAILALIVGWFGVQAGQWWWAPVFLAIAVLWNPVVPLPLSGPWWLGGQFVAAVVFLIAASSIRTERPVEPNKR